MMPTNVFISFERHNLEQVKSIRALANNQRHNLEFHDQSEIDPVKDKVGTPLPYQPHDLRAKPIKNELRRLLKKATKMVIVVGEYTHESNWVNWEIQSFHDRYKIKSGGVTSRIVAIIVRNGNYIILPKLLQTYAVPQMQWDMNNLGQWIKTNPNTISRPPLH